MTTIKQLRCDICNSILLENETYKNFLGILTAKSSMQFVYQGHSRKGDLCYKCATALDEAIKEVKGGTK